MCSANALAVANTFSSVPLDEKVTYRNLGVPPMSEISAQRFGELDMLLVAQSQLHKVSSVRSHRSQPLASQHFLVTADLAIAIDPGERRSRRPTRDRSALKDITICNRFAALFEGQLPDIAVNTIDDRDSHTISAFRAAEQELPIIHAGRHKPWISQITLNALQRRREARDSGDYEMEKMLCKEARKLARRDRRSWLSRLAAEDTWGALRKLRGGKNRPQGRLANQEGRPVSSEQRADTFAEYLEQVQWAVRPARLVEKPPLFPELSVSRLPISQKEFQEAVNRLKDGKACGPDEVPIEYWKAIFSAESGIGMDWLLSLCNNCLASGEVPENWHEHQAALVYKKGDPADCGNYRPICLLNIAYKVFAMVLLRRLLSAGADARMWPSQFGFRPGRSTVDALHCARRAVDRACADKRGCSHLMALDWKKAFDSINADGLLLALRRFGIPEHILRVIRSIYTGRCFRVSDCGTTSARRPQKAGICQGCPLSPFLFIAVMTVLMHDAYADSGECALQAARKGELYDVLYADDTLLLGSCVGDVEALARAVERAGAEYGMSLHWGKTQALNVRSSEHLHAPDGALIKSRGSLLYLGGLITEDGRIDSELSRRIGSAASDFRLLRQVWSHTDISRERKLHYFEAFIMSKLMYGLSSVWLTSSQQRRLDGFHARCLRRIVGIPPAFISRVSNAVVFGRSRTSPASVQLQSQQLLLLGRVGRSPAGSPMRR